MKVFVDTNIFLDYYLDRKDNIRPLGEFAFNFINESIKCKYDVLICEISIIELKNYLGLDRKQVFDRILKALIEKDKLTVLDYSENQFKESLHFSKKYGIPKADALFAILARDNNAILLTRDYHFEIFNKIIKISKPEEL